MIRVRDPDHARHIEDSAIRHLVELRIVQILGGETYDYDRHGEIIVVEPGDTVDALEKQSSCCILRDLFDDSRFGDPEYWPSFEILEEHPGCYDLVFILNDDGFGVELFIPKQAGIDPELLAFCAAYAIPAKSSR